MSKIMPIKRNKSLHQLSKDHHEGLLLCWKIRAGQRNNIETQRVSDYILYFYENHLSSHFTQEEDILFSALPCEDNMVTEALAQHARLKKMIEYLMQEKVKDYNPLLAFADELDNHIRFEERKLFGYIEERLCPEQLIALGNRLQETEQICAVDWKDKFWETQKN